jgi:hypothetical protein
MSDSPPRARVRRPGSFGAARSTNHAYGSRTSAETENLPPQSPKTLQRNVNTDIAMMARRRQIHSSHEVATHESSRIERVFDLRF